MCSLQFELKKIQFESTNNTCNKAEFWFSVWIELRMDGSTRLLNFSVRTELMKTLIHEKFVTLFNS